MAKAHNLPTHPESLFVLSEPPLTQHMKTQSVWYATRLREVIFLLADGHGWVGLSKPQSRGFPEFGRLTYMHGGGILDLSDHVAHAWPRYIDELAMAGVELKSAIGKDFSISSWDFDPWGSEDIVKAQRALFVAHWEDTLTRVLTASTSYNTGR